MFSSQYKVVHLPWDLSGNNPYQTKLAEYLTKQGCAVEGSGYRYWFINTALKEWQADIIHLHWLHSFLIKSSLFKSLVSMTLFVMQLLILRLMGTKIVWTVHNLKNHNNKYLIADSLGTALVARLAHGIIAHCGTAKAEIVNTLGVKNPDKIWVVPHGNYIECYENNLSQTQARKKLNLPASTTVLLFFGLIRPYKGVLELVKTFEKLQPKQTQLLIVGKVWQDSQELGDVLQTKADNNPHLKFIPGFVADKDIQIYMNAADVVVFPYRDILTSGAVLLAMSFGKACLAPNICCISETLDDSGAFLYNPEQENGLLDALSNAIQPREKLISLGAHNYQLAQKLNWNSVAQMTIQVYRGCYS